MLYENFYQLQREAFSLAPDPAFLYMAPSHREALAQLLFAVQARKGFAVLTGEVGTGKTTLLRALLDSAGEGIRTAYILSPPRTRAELYTALLAEFGLPANGPESWSLVLQRFLVEAFEKQITVVAVFDEAQEIPPDVLQEIRLLTNLETSQSKLLQVILAGQPELDRKLESYELRALSQRINLRHSLAPLQSQQTAEYIANRIMVAGGGLLPFDPKACRAIHRYSRGIPRLINLLCDHSLIAGYTAGRATIDAAIVDAAARDLRLARDPRDDQAETKDRGAWLRAGGKEITVGVGVAAVVCLILAAALWLMIFDSHPGRIQEFVRGIRSDLAGAIDQVGSMIESGLR